ncbi:DUF2069 domain-containing protein [Sulfuriferula nivalis]|uniref:Membrane protein n=1 Tax=Sulfuriferula nivalis TaxID=2675298 RepID=A0A809RHJ8_9PROT|nr:DUF2069 domain-containing protein [Sulfuriferula nivalis]BBP01096.1 membrane protein [Sulfuriferula nivalis]
MNNTKLLQNISIVSLIALIFLSVAWEGWLAPLKPGGSMLIFKVLPLLAPLFGILHGKRYTYQWSSLMILVYFTEGAVRAWSDHGISQILAMIEVAFTVTFFFATIYYARATGRAH